MDKDLCSPSYILGLLSRKWVYLILRHMREPARFRDIENSLPTITHHMLAGELKRLEKEQLITHKDNYYSLTDSGKELLEAIEGLITWTSKHKGFSQCPPNQACANCARYESIAQKDHD